MQFFDLNIHNKSPDSATLYFPQLLKNFLNDKEIQKKRED